MKRFITTFAIVLLVCLPSICRDNTDKALDAIFNEYRHADGADYVYINPFFTKMLSMGTLKSACHGITGKLKSVRMLTIGSPTVPAGLSGRIYSLAGNGYEELVRVSDNDGKVRILARMDSKKADTARRLLIFTEEKGECTLVSIDGKFSRDDLAKIVCDSDGGQ